MTKSNAKTTYLKHEFNPNEGNWAALTFPADISGLTKKLRAEFQSTIQRCRGNDSSLQQVMDNLEVLVAWAQVKLVADKAANAAIADAAAARSAEEARQEAFRIRVQAGVTISVMATATGFIEQSPRIGAIYDTADDERGPVAAMAAMMLAEGRDPNSALNIHAFGRPGIGSGQTLGQLAGIATGTSTVLPTASGGLIAIQV